MRDSSKEEAPPLSQQRQRLLERLLRDSRIALPPCPTIPRREASPSWPLTATQQRLWKDWRSGADREPFSEVVLLRLKGLLDVLTLSQALGEVIRRHEILRARFVEADGALSQSPSPEAGLDLSVTDLRGASAPQKEAISRLYSTEQVNRPFSLGRLPLVRANVIVLSTSERLLLVALPRIICDRWSQMILVDELCQHYESFLSGRPSALDEPEIQWGDYAVWQNDRLQMGELDGDKEYWQQKLKSWPPPAGLPLMRSGPRRSGQRRASYKVTLSDLASRQVRRAAQTHKLSVYMILLAGWHTLLSRYSGQDEVCVQTVAANRNRAELGTLIGPLANRLVIKLDLTGNPSFSELMARTKETVVKALEHQELPWEIMVAERARGNEAGRTPLADAMFVMDEGVRPKSVTGGVEVVEERLEGMMTDADLAIVLWQAGEKFEGAIEYRPALFDDETVRHMANGYERLMEVALSNVACRIKNLPPIAY